jgi:hypothetical protein
MRWSGTESDFARAYCKKLEEYGAVVLPIVASEMQQPGWPDRYIVHRKWTGHLENKRGNNQCTTVQRIRLQRLRERGVPAFVLRVKDDMVWFELECGTELMGFHLKDFMESGENIIDCCQQATALAKVRGELWSSEPLSQDAV